MSHTFSALLEEFGKILRNDKVPSDILKTDRGQLLSGLYACLRHQTLPCWFYNSAMNAIDDLFLPGLTVRQASDFLGTLGIDYAEAEVHFMPGEELREWAAEPIGKDVRTFVSSRADHTKSSTLGYQRPDGVTFVRCTATARERIDDFFNQSIGLSLAQKRPSSVR